MPEHATLDGHEVFPVKYTQAYQPVENLPGELFKEACFFKKRSIQGCIS